MCAWIFAIRGISQGRPGVRQDISVGASRLIGEARAYLERRPEYEAAELLMGETRLMVIERRELAAART